MNYSLFTPSLQLDIKCNLINDWRMSHVASSQLGPWLSQLGFCFVKMLTLHTTNFISLLCISPILLNTYVVILITG